MSSILQQYYGIETARPSVALAPMAGVTDLPFRTLCESLGADYSVTEMAATAPQLLASNKNQARLHFTPNNKANILQIIGNDSVQMAEAVNYYTSDVNQSIDLIDINLGCPAKKINRKGAGSALLSDLPLIKSILSAVVAASPVPVTIKTRLGPSHDNYTLLEIAGMAESVGIKLITVHGRTRACRFNGHAQFQEIAYTKKHFPNLHIIANGDISCAEQGKKILNETGCNGLMIGRAAVGNPWLFSEIRQYLGDRKKSHSKKKTIEVNQLILNHIQQTHDFYGDAKGVRFARKHIQAYLNHLNKSEAFHSISVINDPIQQLDQLSRILN